MVYSQARLEAAIRIIKSDNARLQKEQDDKYARTHYRDDFQLRKNAKASRPLTSLYLDFGSDQDDDDYEPNEGRSRPKNMSSNRRSGCGADDTPRKTQKKLHPAARNKTSRPEYEISIPGGLASVFISLKLYESKSKTVMRTLSQQHDTRLNMWMEEHSFDEHNLWAHTGGSLKRLSTPEEMRQMALEWAKAKASLSAVRQGPSDLDASVSKLRSLRSGKVRTTVVDRDKKKSKKGKKKAGSILNPKITKGKRKRDERSAGRQSSFPLTSEPGHGVFLGSSFDDAICIDDDSSDADEAVFNDLAAEHISNLARDESNTTTTSTPPPHAVIDLTELQEEDENAAEVTTIHTHFAHPINFEARDPPCDFCSDYRFGITGHSLVEVTIARSATGIITELGNGHAAVHPATRMCALCAGDRMMITRCLTHRMRRTNEPYPRCDIDAYASDLARKDPDRCLDHPPHPIHQICTICAMPATFGCVSLQRSDRSLNPVLNPDLPFEAQNSAFQRHMKHLKERGLPCTHELKPPLYGCGLALCERCKVVVEGCGGRLIRDDLVTAATARGGKELLRGDVDFLFRDGGLWKCYNHR